MGINPIEINIAARKAMRYVDQETEVLEAKVNNLASLKEGSTTGDAELQDIRVGYNGTTYANAGEAVREQIKAVNEAVEELEQNGTGDGVTDTEKNLILTLFRNAAYTSAGMGAVLTQLEALWSGSGGGGEEPDEPDVPDEPDEPVGTTYTITAELINLTSSNVATSIAMGSQYKATLTPNEGYMLPSTMGGTVSVKMGGVDITSEVYSYNNGEINITSVTGDVEITATAFAKPKLIEDGLESLFDLRSAEISTNGNYKYIGATKGNGGLLYNNVDKEVTDKGIVFGNDRPAYTKDGSISWNDYAGTNYQYTIVVCYYAPAGHGYSLPFPNQWAKQKYPNWNPAVKYVDTANTTVTIQQDDVILPSATGAGFIAGAVSVGADKVVFATPDGVVTTFDSAEYEAFDHFGAYSSVGVDNPNRSIDSVTFYAVYNRALSADEMAEVLNYLMTEVNN
jgi:hypothetical protein